VNRLFDQAEAAIAAGDDESFERAMRRIDIAFGWEHEEPEALFTTISRN
jgi:hypothetical protein